MNHATLPRSYAALQNPGGVQPDQISSFSLRYNREKIKAATMAKHPAENTHTGCIGFDSKTGKGHGQTEAESHLTIMAYPSLKFIDIAYPSDGCGEQYAQTVLPSVAGQSSGYLDGWAIFQHWLEKWCWCSIGIGTRSTSPKSRLTFTSDRKDIGKGLRQLWS
ncbi:hypothetical protein Ciccas_003398 [Cichlidogyrus casuarinus]|uniref:Uncharacterized protein n=1 Tax=Cichlidogyrus casuarinus TaxID=1844966 RepID=A0ABD2QF70_9PLAT